MATKQNTQTTFNVNSHGTNLLTFLKNINPMSIWSDNGTYFDRIVVNNEFTYYFKVTNSYTFNVNPILAYEVRKSGVYGIDYFHYPSFGDLDEAFIDATGSIGITIDVYLGDNRLGQVNTSIPANVYGFGGYSHTIPFVNPNLNNLNISKDTRGVLMAGFDFSDLDTFANYPLPVIDGYFGLVFYKGTEGEKISYNPNCNYGCYEIPGEQSYRPYYYQIAGDTANYEIWTDEGSGGGKFRKFATTRPITLCDDVAVLGWVDYWGAFHLWDFKILKKTIQRQSGTVFHKEHNFGYADTDFNQNGYGYGEIGINDSVVMRLNSGQLNELDKRYLHSLITAETVWLIDNKLKYTPVQLLTKNFNMTDNNFDLAIKMLFIKI